MAFKENFTKFSDSEIWDRFRQGDEMALDYIYYKYVQSLFNYGDKITSDRELVEDCVQETFIECWQKHYKLGPTDSIKFYLFKALRRKILRKLEKETRHQDKYELVDTYNFNVEFSYEKNLLQEQLSTEQSFFLSQALNSLSKRQKEAIFLKFYDNLSFQEISEVMGISVKSTYKLIALAVEAIRKGINKRKFYFFDSSVRAVTLLAGIGAFL